MRGLAIAVAFALAMLPQNAPASDGSEARLRAHVQMLAGEIGERNLSRSGTLQRAAEYIASEWRAQGYAVVFQPYEVDGVTVANLEVSILGTGLAKRTVLTGAHYDSVPGSPGANDNASGVATLLELSRSLANRRFDRTLRFVAFANEEQPYFGSGARGSRVYARAARERGEDITAMLSLETLGYYDDRPGSQKYPRPFSWFYPDRGNFIGFISNLGSRGLLGRAVAAFRASSDFPVERAATFEWIDGVAWSDHASFWEAGYDAVMVTDTALFRYPYYHTAADTPAKLDYARLARVTKGLLGVVEALARE